MLSIKISTFELHNDSFSYDLDTALVILTSKQKNKRFLTL